MTEYLFSLTRYRFFQNDEFIQFWFLIKKRRKENVEDRPSSDIQNENVDQAPAAPGDVATGSGASASGDPGPRGPVRDERV